MALNLFLLTFLIISQNEKKQILLLVTISRREKVHDLLLWYWCFVSSNRAILKLTHWLPILWENFLIAAGLAIEVVIFILETLAKQHEDEKNDDSL